MKRFIIVPLWELTYRLTLYLLCPLNGVLCLFHRNDKQPHSVLHISYMVHIPFYTVQLLRNLGYRADYLAVGTSPFWSQSDYIAPNSRLPFLAAFKEFLFFWSVVVRYETVHLHFMITMTRNGWELPWLKRLGRKMVVHYRGCEVRHRERNMARHPQTNICQECDYNASICRSPLNLRRQQLGARYGDRTLVTTPDLLDFVPQAVHFPFLAPQELSATPEKQQQSPRRDGEIRIAHVTAHPGIEGTRQIQSAIDRLRAKGYNITFIYLHEVPHGQVMKMLGDVDLSIGKMKMGYYANAQIEAMYLGVPTITYVRREFMTPELEESGFIFTTLDSLESTIEHYLTHPQALAAKKAIARTSILKLHDNQQLGQRLIKIYEELNGR